LTGFPTKENDMELVAATSHLAVLPGSAELVATNLYLSSRMSRHQEPSYGRVGLRPRGGTVTISRTDFSNVATPIKVYYVFVSAASPVGKLGGQLAKITDCFVADSAGSDENTCNVLTISF
jgi:hypothetical protein